MSEPVDLFERSPYILEQVELFNWGPFQGLHRAGFDRRGTAIIGQTGSGKTTLVDAFMTLVTARPLYNLASTGGHESDRDLISYIRGVSGADNESGDNRHIARPGATLTGIAARFSDGNSQVTLTALLWLDGTSSAVADLKRIWIFARDSALGLADWLDHHHAGGARAVKQIAKEHQINPHESKSAYLALVMRFFEVGENAFALLNRAAGLKQLNSIDALFRELVLEDRAAFDQAKEVVAGFDTLKEIHAELETARDQQKSLLPIEQEERNRQAKEAERERLEALKQLLPQWFAGQGIDLWQARRGELEGQAQTLSRRIDALRDEEGRQEAETESLHRAYIEQGGGDIQQLEEIIRLKEAEQRRRQLTARDYAAVCQAVGLTPATDAPGFAATQAEGRRLGVALGEAADAVQAEAFRHGGGLKALEERERALTQELAEAQAHRGSNIDAAFLRFKQELADAVGLAVDEVAFVAELVEVKEGDAAWRGAIERALGAHRLRLIVPAPQMRAALRWVNGRDNRLHVRLLDAGEYGRPAEFRPDGFTRKLNYRPHPLREAAKVLLADIDRHCVADSDALHRIPHAMTREGLMSGHAGQFDKQDQRPLHEGWMTGFDNRDRLRQLEQSLGEVRGELAAQRGAFADSQRRYNELAQRIALLGRLEGLAFADLDEASVAAELEHARQRLVQMQSPDSDAARARRIWEAAKQALHQQRGEIQQHEAERQVVRRELNRAEERIALLRRRLGVGLSAAQQALGNSRFGELRLERLEMLDDEERKAAERLQGELDAVVAGLNQCVNRLIRQMRFAQEKDTGALSEVGEDVIDIPHYLRRLEILTKEALPEKLERFLAYLNKSSDEGVTQLLTAIDNEVALIEERIDELNRTMAKVDFQPGRFLRLIPRRVQHQTLTDIQRAQRELRSAALKEDQGESHYKALVELVRQLREQVERSKTQGARALLDPRYRLQFVVHVIEREEERIVESRTGSQGGSGGEKEIIASYILTASLSYALCPDGLGRPLFGTVVLDEAFSKSSQAVAARIIEALRRFGLHPLFVTPNKEMRLLRAHTRSAILVHRRDNRATTTSISWEELDRRAVERLGVSI